MECVSSFAQFCLTDKILLVLCAFGFVVVGWIFSMIYHRGKTEKQQNQAQEILDEVTEDLDKKFQREDWEKIKEHIERRENGRKN